MNMIDLKQRVASALSAGIIDNEKAQHIYKELARKDYYGCRASNTTRDRMLTNRFGI